MTPAQACYCYILKCSDGTFYTGWTTDPERRIKRHNAGQASRYTRSRRPVRLVFLEPQSDRLGAMRRERVIKNMTRARKSRLIEELREANAHQKGKRKSKWQGASAGRQLNR
jgi:putative endonuclease